MSNYLYTVYSLYYKLTFIGVIFHEIAHKNFAQSRGLEILEVDYFSLSGDSLGYVKHAPPKTYWDVFVINIAPFIFNTSISIVALSVLPLYLEYIQMSIIQKSLLYGVIYWFSVSLLLHSFPSRVDLNNISKAVSVLWEQSHPKVTTKLQTVISNASLMTSIILSPILVVIHIIHFAIFSFKHIPIITSYPQILLLRSLSKTKTYGSQIYYSAAVIVLSNTVISPLLIQNIESSFLL